MLRLRKDNSRALEPSAPPPQPPPPAREITLLGILFFPARLVIDMFVQILSSPSTHRVIFRLVVLGTLYALSLAGALAAYFGFYRAWVPEVTVSKDVWLQYSAVQPSAALRLYDSKSDLPLWSVPSSASVFAEDMAYDVFVEFDIPAATALAPTPLTIHLELQSERSEPLYASQRPVVLQNVRKLLDMRRFLPFRPPVHTVVTVLRGITPRPSQPNALALARRFGGRVPGDTFVARATVTLSIDETSRGDRNVLPALASGAVRLRFQARLFGIAYYMHHHPIISIAVFVSGFTAIEVGIVTSLWLAAAFYFSLQTTMSDTLTSRIATACRLAEERSKGDAAADEHALAALSRAAQLADAASVISPNDTLREVSTMSLRVLFLPSIQADIEASARIKQGEDMMAARKSHVQHAIGAARLFLQATTQLGALSPQLAAILKRQTESPTTTVGAAERREQKITLFKHERTLRKLLDTFRDGYRTAAHTRAGAGAGAAAAAGSSEIHVPQDAFYDLLITESNADGEDDDDDDNEHHDNDTDRGSVFLSPAPPKTLRAYLLLLIELHAVHTAGVLDSALQELELLRNAPAPSAQAPDTDPEWRLDSRFFSGSAGGPLLSDTGKPLRPFTIMPSRAQIKDEVFRPSHRLPTMTIDEYLEEERRRGNIISGGGPAQAAQPTPPRRK
ncbi:Type 2A phosphatase-associated protein 42 [Malassezia cuniculi]|uniref:Type 2A phosphatase-associated protein 42 n=1 Tax=Malassezia cuniculi TaxID=948313 RepID=A0AAF0JDI7_9BASI|nr:Type 2A phosphatase-associated protein 42 [Malassezia cuniculi]